MNVLLEYALAFAAEGAIPVLAELNEDNLDKVKKEIEAAGGKMSDFTKLTIFVTRIENNKQVWRARAEFFKGDFPACSLVEVSRLAAPNIYVEIEGIAHLGKGVR